MQAQIRQEGFDALAAFTTHASMNSPVTSMDFSDELASLMSASQSHERHQHQHHPHSHNPNEPYANRTHNIFDMSAPATAAAHHHHHNNSISSTSSYLFNSTLPALNSSMRYENPTEPTAQATSLRHAAAGRTPSPLMSDGFDFHVVGRRRSEERTSRTRSRSGSGSGSSCHSRSGLQSSGGIGPTRNTRSTVRSAASSQMSLHTQNQQQPQPHPILIPNSAGGWFDYAPHAHGALPTPESLHSHSFHHPGTTGSSYTPFTSTSPFDLSPSESHHLFDTTAGGGLSGLSVSASDHGGDFNSNTPPTPPTTSRRRTTATSNANANSNLGPVEKQTLLATEKKRKRRESHNAVERRRRDNINDRIAELAGLIPEVLLGVLNTNSSSSSSAADANSTSTTLSTCSASAAGEGAGEESDVLGILGFGSGLGMGLGVGVGLWETPTPTLNTPCGPVTKQEEDSAPSPSLTPASPPSAASPSLTTAATSPSLTTATTAAATAGATAAAGANAPLKANKGMILRKSVEYIRYLQQVVAVQGERNRELEREVGRLRGGAGAVGAAGGSVGNVGGAGERRSRRSGKLDRLPEYDEEEEEEEKGEEKERARDNLNLNLIVEPISPPLSADNDGDDGDDNDNDDVDLDGGLDDSEDTRDTKDTQKLTLKKETQTRPGIRGRGRSVRRGRQDRGAGESMDIDVDEDEEDGEDDGEDGMVY